MDFTFAKVLGAWGGNTAAFVASVTTWVQNTDSFLKVFLTLVQIGVGLATIVYIAYKARNAKREIPK